ncbi:TonB-dependent receptor domain-containing protein [Gynurincola endophyticus]|uniref:TonB-dependent receptor domain-containing protein n=1 Tax=Gynurincola endophyticus TaxID=2479004 RepID=UPI000F8CBB2F|nr:TonB-dependent receptor [Gynurincola endophyticus]
MKQKFCKALLGALFLIIGSVLQAQTIQGVVLNDKKEPLSGVTITIDGVTGGKTTDDQGAFSWTLKEPGVITIHFSIIGYQPKTLTKLQLQKDKIENITVTLAAAEEVLKTAQVTVSARKESVNAIIQMQRRSPAIADGISAESIKKSPDRNSSDVLKRVTGTSIQDNRFVVVRGLTDRYNIALLNNALLPSTEPDRRAFSFDIIPSQLLDNIFIYKTATPDLPGDFAGGVTQISTKDVPTENFLQVGGGVSYNTMSTGKPFKIGYLGKTDYLGYENGDRTLPASFPSRKNFQGSFFADRAEQSAKIKNTYGDRYHGNALPNQSYQLTWGQKIDRDNGAQIGSVLSLNYKNSQTMSAGIRSEYDNQYESVNGAAYRYEDSTYKFSTALGALWNLSYKKGKTKITLRNLYNSLFETNNLLRSGYQYYSGGVIVTAQGSETVVKSMLSSQLEGVHTLRKNRSFNWNINYSFTQRDHPDYKFAPFIKDSAEIYKNDPPMVVLRDTYRFFANLKDHAIGANVNYTAPLNWKEKKVGTIKMGVFSQFKQRDFSARIFRYNRSPQAGFDESILTQNINEIFSKSNMHANGLALEEITNNTDSYDAQTQLLAAYGMVDNKVTDRLKLVWGIRAEYFDSKVNTFDFSGSARTVPRNYVDILPSLNLTYELTSISNLRFAASRTVGRPELREMANFSFYDFVRNLQVRGRFDVERSQHTNIDLRYEVYPNNGEVFSITAFYKHFKNPIELRVDPGSPSLNPILEYYNANAATSFGLEAEVRKRLSFLGDAAWLDDITVFANAAVIKSKVDIEGIDMAYADADRPMQGQSPYLINTGFVYSHPTSGWSFSGMLNRIGHRVEAVGNDPKGFPDIYENGRTLIDLQLSKRILKDKGELKVNVSDLLNQSFVFYQNYRTDTDKISKRSYKESEDRIWMSYKVGSSLGLSFTYQF